jgi:hypothetical protein
MDFKGFTCWERQKPMLLNRLYDLDDRRIARHPNHSRSCRLGGCKSA